MASPTVTGPVTGGNGATVLRGTTIDLASVGYTQSEFFLSGNATSYAPTAALGSDGRWQVAPASAAPYTTRIVVYRPANPARFNGSVIVEWLNVTGGSDVAVDWTYTHNELIRDGFAWVGVSAQAVGVAANKTTDPVRYAALSHPGDSYSYDIFSQAGQAILDSAPTILGQRRPRAMLAEGESQSASRLTAYVNAIQPLAHVYNGFLLHSRAGGSAALSQAPQPDVQAPQVVHLRPDLGVPVLTVQTETDLMLLGYLAARQPDSPGIRLWEMAGTSHGDNYTLTVGPGDNGSGAAGLQQLNSMLNPPTGTTGFTCDTPINTGPMHYVMDGAQYALNRWVTAGVAPAVAPRLQVTTSGSAPAFVLDANGNVKGGVRTPAVDVPVATLSGLGQPGASFCRLFGTTVPFDAVKLEALYPTHVHFVERWAAATGSAVFAGFIRPADAAELVTAAARSSIGG
ncbi:alpha/beta hydrolase domain-containing protein [Pseudofrankia sp. BMG5.36]|uniref:alpha/beta hydrolase domain-containing protein n=1 Tax=Pseudofrankia sp. BMG5.36 TaxID=1834512 RepID=UPI0018E2D566|nr:alpha/beta hydrolase domain-containing protein [Pseudofrankia sp. BMG5.36]